MVITTRMLRDRLAFKGPSSYADLLELAPSPKDVIQLSEAMAAGMLNGQIRAKNVATETGELIAIYYTDWSEAQDRVVSLSKQLASAELCLKKAGFTYYQPTTELKIVPKDNKDD